MRVFRWFTVLFVALGLSLSFVACEDKKDEKKEEKEEGPKADKFDETVLKDGESVTLSLKFWMLEKSAVENGIVDNAHFDDADLARVVLLWDEPLRAKMEGLEQGKIYKVTFNYKASDGVLKGSVTAVE